MVNAQVSLGTASSFAVLAASAITSTGQTVIVGEMGIYPDTATSITGFPPGLSGTVHGADTAAQGAQKDAMTAYTELAALTPTSVLTGQDLGGMTLAAGVYNFASSGQLTGRLTLDGKGSSSSFFVFQFGSTITTATAASVVLINGAQACNVFWQVGSSATLGTSTQFVGTVIAEASITANSGVACQGGLFALTAAVTMIDDAITAAGSCSAGALPSSSSSASTSAGASSTPGLTSTSGTAPKTVTVTSTKTITDTDTMTDTVTNTVTRTMDGSGVTKTVTRTSTCTSTDWQTATNYKTTTTTTTVSKTSTVSAKCTNSKVARYVIDGKERRKRLIPGSASFKFLGDREAGAGQQCDMSYSCAAKLVFNPGSGM
ncbi:hypothetical protein MMC27_004390 [Xylographa pallens]|nr:hypothetical protein [Xylographa pallens]